MDKPKLHAWLVDDHHPDRKYRISNDFLIGRQSTCDLVIPDERVSRQHAIIRIAQGHCIIQDQNSRMGIRVNGEKSSSARLRNGDRISIGDHTYQFKIGQLSSAEVSASNTRLRPVSRPQAAAPQYPSLRDNSELAMARALAAQKSYVGISFLVWLLYYIGFFIVGLIMNIVLLAEANGIQKRTGINPSGTGCLWILLVLHLILPACILTALLVGGTAVLGSMAEFFGDMNLDFLKELLYSFY